METPEGEGSASPRGEHDTGTKRSPAVRFSRLVDVGRVFPSSDHPLEQEILQEAKEPQHWRTRPLPGKPHRS